jgi:quinol-cytochrome oxidoreductase complex cytochrome b subunit
VEERERAPRITPAFFFVFVLLVFLLFCPALSHLFGSTHRDVKFCRFCFVFCFFSVLVFELMGAKHKKKKKDLTSKVFLFCPLVEKTSPLFIEIE